MTDTAAPPASFAAQFFGIDGIDADAFAQAQFASDVAMLAPGHWQWSAWLDAQGRVRCLMHLLRNPRGELRALLRGGSANAMVASLRRFVLRAKVELRVIENLAFDAGGALPPYEVVDMPHGIALGFGDRSLLLREAGETTGAAALEQLALADVREGFPWLTETALDALLPSALGLYRLGAVSIGKGCYPGQEIVARLHYRGGHKQHLYRLGGVAGMRSGERIEANDQDAGLLLNLAGDEALAVLRDERLPATATPHILQQYPA